MAGAELHLEQAVPKLGRLAVAEGPGHLRVDPQPRKLPETCAGRTTSSGIP